MADRLELEARFNDHASARRQAARQDAGQRPAV